MIVIRVEPSVALHGFIRSQFHLPPYLVFIDHPWGGGGSITADMQSLHKKRDKSSHREKNLMRN